MKLRGVREERKMEPLIHWYTYTGHSADGVMYQFSKLSAETTQTIENLYLNIKKIN